MILDWTFIELLPVFSTHFDRAIHKSGYKVINLDRVLRLTT